MKRWLLGLGIYAFCIVAGSLLYTEPMPLTWPHEFDTPMYRMENTDQWVCVSGTPTLYDWCSDAGLDEDKVAPILDVYIEELKERVILVHILIVLALFITLLCKGVI